MKAQATNTGSKRTERSESETGSSFFSAHKDAFWAPRVGDLIPLFLVILSIALGLTALLVSFFTVQEAEIQKSSQDLISLRNYGLVALQKALTGAVKISDSTTMFVQVYGGEVDYHKQFVSEPFTSCSYSMCRSSTCMQAIPSQSM